MEGQRTLTSDEYEIEDARDVHEVIDWANAESGRRASERPDLSHTYGLYVVSQRPDRPADEAGLILIAGIDPSEESAPASPRLGQRARMSLEQIVSTSEG
jgi:hypothetical protein